MKFMVVALAALLLAGCAGNETDDETPPEGNGHEEIGNTMPANETVDVEIEVRTSGTYPVDAAYNQDLEVPEGANVTLTFYNDDPNSLVSHDWYAEIEGAATPRIGSGESVTINFIAPAAGEYPFWCSVGNHRDQGMEGTLTVTSLAAS